ncbi:MAG: pyruvate ferredoxin oxidoreductase [Proteobacteria bacterium]|uniref:Pyruvate ferredoxin oxidoreductase n=1 Tax=Candidatus Avisuccinivibrio stercorigallinarum TaxID=2840704 RepID=A0A9D9DBK0_9GAMM|nr:pyruvate ferredoxin oxidoreductase [Candidatus Avisuccinivibrio stercorigallinarum]
MLDAIKFYQTGSNTVGNRLLNPSMRAVQASVDRPNTLISGHRACQGCGEALGARYAIDAAMRATGGQLMIANATGCLEVFSTPYPESAWRLPWIHSLFGNTAAVGSGLAVAARVRAAKAGNTNVPRVIAQGGDGGTTDIGFGPLSGMFERNDDVLYICYDNQAYMNTGVQRSSATPPAARTATTQLVGDEPGADWGKGKNVPLIAMAHGIPYVATASVCDLKDLEYKVEKAMSFHGARYIQILVPCPLGWGCASGNTVSVARLACETGFYPIFEAEYGKITSVRKIRQKQPVINFLKMQRRYAHLTGKKADPKVLARIQALCDDNIKSFDLLGDDIPETMPVPVQAHERSHEV